MYCKPKICGKLFLDLGGNCDTINLVNVNMYEIYLNLKKNNNDKVVIIKNGEFYYAYDKDSYIINYLLGYKVISVNDNIYSCFPNRSLDNIFNTLNKECIGYVLFDGKIIDKTFGDSELYHNILLKYYDNKNKKDLIDKICFVLNTKHIDELKKIYDGIK